MNVKGRQHLIQSPVIFSIEMKITNVLKFHRASSVAVTKPVPPEVHLPTDF